MDMTTLKALLWMTCAYLLATTLTSYTGWREVVSPLKNAKTERTGFAVVELYTSEGCSSCPPADEELAMLTRDTKGKNVYLLAYHVDYWDRLGWKDIFSDPAYSQRQIHYGKWLTSSVYTPQTIVNGRAQFIGSERYAIRSNISAQLEQNAAVSLKVEAQEQSGQLHLAYDAMGDFLNGSLQIAVLQKTAQSNVRRGENAGSVLNHVQIVRKLQIENLNPSGTGIMTVSLPKGFDPVNWEVLAMVQDKSNGRILGATRVDLLNARRESKSSMKNIKQY
jgi:hypothetical protein